MKNGANKTSNVPKDPCACGLEEKKGTCACGAGKSGASPEEKQCCHAGKEREAAAETGEDPQEEAVQTQACCCGHGPDADDPQTTSSAGKHAASVSADEAQASGKQQSSACTCEGTSGQAEDASGCRCQPQKSDQRPAAENGCGCGSHAQQKESPAATQGYCSCCGPAPKKKGYSTCCGEIAEKKDTFFGKYGNFFILGISLVSLIVSFVMGEIGVAHDSIWHYIDFGMIAVLFCGVPIMIRAGKKLLFGKGFSGRITSPLLISISMLACLALQILIWTGTLPTEDGHSHTYIFAAGEVAWLMAVGSAIEDFTVGKARAGIERLVKLAPTTAKFRKDGEIVEVPLSEVKVGDVVVVLPNDMISVDGAVVSGSSAVDQAVMTGESVPVDKAPGDQVFGGTWNKSGALEIRVTKAQDDMTVNKLRKLVEEAEGKKAPISKLADRFASFIIPSAIVIAILIFVFNYLVFSTSLLQSIVRAVTMLVVFCPCALALATPTAVAAGLGNATKKGMLVKSGGALELLAKVETVAFDKTGTLTMGNIEVESVRTFGIGEVQLLQYAGSAETFSEHPIAKAIVEYAKQTTTLIEPKQTRSLVGIGVEAEIEGERVVISKWEDAKNEGAAAEVRTAAEQLLREGKTLAVVFVADEIKGLIALVDRLRDGSAECVQALNKMNISSVMLTGDNAFVAENIAAKTGLQAAYSSLMPEDKLRKIEELKQDKGRVCMIGDGVNDAPALAAADCSIAMGALGSDVAIETADVALMTSDIRKVPALIQLARSMLKKIKGNIALSMTINFASVILAAFGILNPILGALVHNASSILVVVNSSLLLLKK